MTNTLDGIMSKWGIVQLMSHAICLRVKGGGACGDRFGQGERAENTMYMSKVETKVQLRTPATAIIYENCQIHQYTHDRVSKQPTATPFLW
jgi:hypothetical protein